MTKKQISIKELIKGIAIICSYFLLTNILYIPFYFFIKNNYISKQLGYILIYILLTLIYCLLYNKTLKKDFKDFKNNKKEILKITINYWIKGLFIMLVSSFIISIFKIDNNVNQQANIDLLKEMPVYEITCACIFAPIIEELVFRRNMKDFTDNKNIYAITSGLIFGLVHVISSLSSINNLIMLLYLIPYGALGIAFGYAYSKTNNIYGTMLIHSLHNTISIIEIIILGGLL